MRLVHLSDPHLTSLRQFPPHAFWGKRGLSYLSWRLKRSHSLTRATLEQLTDAVRGERAAQVLVTGDLAQLGQPAEIRAGADWLPTLGPPERVLLVPGNHDLFAADSWPAAAEHWHPYLHLDAAAGAAPAAAAYPVRREVGGTELIGMCSARPTPVSLATGHLGEAQLTRLAAMLRAARGRFRCLLLHHPPLPGLIGRRKALDDAADLAAVLKSEGVELVLHGHLHRNAAARLGYARIFGTAAAASGSSRAPAAYRVFDVEPVAAGWQVRMTLRQLVTAGPQRGAFATVAEERWLAPADTP